MIKFENEQLEKYLMFKLDKQGNFFLVEELKAVEDLVLNPININFILSLNQRFLFNLTIIFLRGLGFYPIIQNSV